ncbi:transposase [Anaeroselena agilis]|uniref:Transposase n=1 Tax=Anaeroselena agilis TaxID=3063788 RepID=A0ABU3P2X1_9FIRM|nr:transposase [Selenomonadales bacterium 4137-cl]
MPRQARKKSESGVYHIMLRGINRQVLFEEEEDKAKFLDTIKQYKTKKEYKILGYCLMDNHAHILIKEGNEPIANTMKRIGVSYVCWYNWKNKRRGHLFQDRYKSESIEDDQYLLSVLRYIHQNPMNAGIEQEISRYKWSSYNEYVGVPKIVDTAFVLGMFSENEKLAREEFARYMVESGGSKISLEEDKRLTDNEAREKIQRHINMTFAEVQQLDKEKRNEILRKMKDIEEVSIRQIARITGFTVNVVAKA